VGPRAGLDRCGKSRPHRDSISDGPNPSHSLYRLRYYPAHICNIEDKNIIIIIIIIVTVHFVLLGTT